VIAAIAAITTLIAVINLSPLIDRYAVQELLDVNGENTLVAWLSSALLLAIAVAAFVGAITSSSHRDRRGWSAMAVFFVVLSADETASMHELAGEIANRFVDIAWLPSLYMWVLVVVPFAAAVAVWMFVWLRKTLGTGTPSMRLAAGALALWLVVPVLEAVDPSLGGPLVLVVIEESLEIVGELMMLAAVALHLIDRGVRVVAQDQAA